MTKAEQALAARARVVILNGPAGVGKTTTGRALAAMARSAACVHGDDLKGFIVRRDAPVATGLGYRNGATVAADFHRGRLRPRRLRLRLRGSRRRRDVSRRLHRFGARAPVHPVG
jgi:hypothetical protein